MCRFKSGIILKDKVFVSDYEDHNKMLNELGIENNSQNTENLFVKASLVPKYENMFSDIDSWELVVTQDILPDWYVKDRDRNRMIQAVKEWAKNHIHAGIDNLEITSGKSHYIQNCKNVVISGDATIESVYGHTMIKSISGSAIVKNITHSVTIESIYDNAIVNHICGETKVSCISGKAKIGHIYGEVIVNNICNNVTVTSISDDVIIGNLYGNAIVDYIGCSAIIKRIYGDAVIKNVYGNAKINSMLGNPIIKNIFDNAIIANISSNATVKKIYGNAKINYIYGNATIETAKGLSTIITSPYDEFKNKDKLILLEGAILKDSYNKVIYHSGDYKLVSVSGTGKLEES